MHSTPRRPITRNREMLACTECRRRKLKCDRSNPCGSCVKRGDESDCKYQRFARGKGERERRIEAESRLEHLEQLVQELAHQSDKTTPADGVTRSTGPASASIDQINDSSTDVSPGIGHAYQGSTHWSAMLQDIDILRNAIVPFETHDAEAYNDTGSTDIMFGATPALDLEDILTQYLPLRPEADRLVAAYFRSKAVQAPFIHSDQFARQYKIFWDSPATASPLWISILFSICHIAANLLVTQTETLRRPDHFSMAAAHCLVAGKYNKPSIFGAEAALLFLQAECLTCLEISSDVGTLFGLLMRLLTRMGYHRDPDHLNLTPFEGEMRRRTWSLALQLDLLVSFQLGLPSNVQYPTWDTRPPTSLLDSDFDEGCSELPAARPDTTATDILFYIAKHKLMAVFEKVLRHSLSPAIESDPGPIDAEIRTTYSSVPLILRPRPMAESVVDPPYLIVTRLCVHLIYAKCLCVLHRPHAVRGQLDSVRVCYEASSDLLWHFCDAYVEFQPGGQNESERWFLGSITWNDFLLGSMVICLVICVMIEKNVDIEIDRIHTTDLLRRSHVACTDRAAGSKETQRVKRLLEATMLRFNQQRSTNGHQVSASAESNGVSGGVSFNDTIQSLDGVPVLSPLLPPWDDGSTSGTQSLEMGQNRDDPSWAYLEQFLQIPGDDFMADL